MNVFNSLRKALQRGNEGSASVEFALVLPVLFIFLIGTLELANYALANVKLDKATFAMADFATEGPVLNRAYLEQFSQAVPEIMRPYEFRGSVIFTSVARGGRGGVGNCSSGNCIVWQHSTAFSFNASRIGRPGGPARIPGNYVIPPDQDVIVAEIFYTYSPLLLSSSNFVPGLRPKTLYKVAVFKPREGRRTILN